MAGGFDVPVVLETGGLLRVDEAAEVETVTELRGVVNDPPTGVDDVVVATTEFDDDTTPEAEDDTVVLLEPTNEPPGVSAAELGNPTLPPDVQPTSNQPATSNAPTRSLSRIPAPLSGLNFGQDDTRNR